jgi:hypothetical protein
MVPWRGGPVIATHRREAAPSAALATAASA